MKANHLLPALVAALTLGSLATAQDALNWSGLTEAQQQVLNPYAESWNRLPVERQQRLAEGAKRWSDMDTDEREAAGQRFRNWQNLSDNERTAIRDRYNQRREQNQYAFQDELREALTKVKDNVIE